MNHALSIMHLSGFAFFVSLSVSGFMMAARISDRPNGRSAHKDVTPTAGGLGIIAGMAAALLALRFFYPSLENVPLLLGLSGLGLLLGGLGLLDDKFIAPTKLKFFLIAVISLATPLITGSPSHFPFGAMAFAIPAPIAYGGAALWVFVVINAVNFFDGSNGIMGASMAIASAGLSLYAMIIGVTDVALIAACLSAAIIGFLPYNYRKRAQIFCGDTGALFIGFVFAAAVLRLNAHDSGNLSLFAGPLLILPLLMDVLLTILRRIRDKDALLTPHSRHLYQTMIGAGRSHMRVAGHYVRGAIIASLAAIIGGATGLIASMFYFLIWAVLVALIYRAAIKYYGARDQRGR